jgi:sRNA-binding protein
MRVKSQAWGRDMATRIKQQDREEILEFYKMVANNHPQTFSGPAVPVTRVAVLKVGIHKDLAEKYPDVPKKTIRHFVNGYVYHPAYLRLSAVAQTSRIDLDGRISGVVTEDQAQHSLALMEKHAAERKARQQSKKA